jgi:chemotaxis protein CheC
MDLRALDALQLDALREAANIGAGHAATALSQLTKQRVMLSVPELRIVGIEEAAEIMGDPERAVAAVLMRMLGDATGRTVQIFPAATALRLTSLLLGRPQLRFPEDFGPLEQSTLKEVGNIITAAYVNALSEFTGMLLIMSAPEFAIDMAGAVLQTSCVNFGVTNDYVFFMNTELIMEGSSEGLGAQFLLLPDDASLAAMLRALGML